MRIFLVVLLAVAVLASLAQAREPELVSKAVVDLDRYMGRWWVIGNIPYFAERGKIASADVYALRPDGKIDNVFVYRKAFDKPEKRMNAQNWPGCSVASNAWTMRSSMHYGRISPLSATRRRTSSACRSFPASSSSQRS